MRLTKRFAETVQLPAGLAEVYHMDDDVRGFGLRLQRRADGSVLRSWVIRYRKNGSHQRRLKVGEPSRMSLEDARKEARKLLTKADQGGDPIAERKAETAEPTLAEKAETFLILHASKRKSRLRTERTLPANILPILGRKKFKDVTKEDVERLALRPPLQRGPLPRRILTPRPALTVPRNLDPHPSQRNAERVGIQVSPGSLPYARPAAV